MLQDWTIQARAEQCDLTGRPFADGEHFFTLLYRDKGDSLHRRDVSEGAWRTLQQSGAASGDDPPFSFWRSKFTAEPPAPAALQKEDAESLLRRFLQEGRPEEARAAYILALMLERKRLLRPTDTRDGANGQRLLLYEHVRTGETFVVADPQLRLDQLADVQREVAELLATPTVPGSAIGERSRP
jgi:hypothetical protein